jgi:hypothetical protein
MTGSPESKPVLAAPQVPLAGPFSRRALLGGVVAAGLGAALVPRLASAAPLDEACAPGDFSLKKKNQEAQKKYEEARKQLGAAGQEQAQKDKLTEEQYQKEGFTGAAAKVGPMEQNVKRQKKRESQERDEKGWRKAAEGAATVPLWLDLPDGRTLEGSIVVDSIVTPEACGDLPAISFEARLPVREGGLAAKELAAAFQSLLVDETTGEGKAFGVQFGDTAEFVLDAELTSFEYSYSEPQYLGAGAVFSTFAVVLGLNTSKKAAAVPLAL